jgi:RNA polymerase sigma-70 factor, ECF subfamily
LSSLNGDSPHFGDTLLACQAPLYRYARSLSRDPSSAEELVQQTFERALAALSRPVPPTEEATRAWLFTIVRNLWHNQVRQRNRWAIGSRTLDEIPAGAEPLDLQVARKLLQSEVRDAIDMLPEQFREVVLLRDIEGLSYAEIARVVDCPVGTVMSRLSRARDTLRRTLCLPAQQYREARR